MKSVNLLEVENCCISIMLYKGKTPPSPPLKLLDVGSIILRKRKTTPLPCRGGGVNKC